jgi:uncharacterized protein
VLGGGHGSYAPDEILIARAANGAVRGVAYFGAQLVVAADDDGTLDAFAEETRRHPYLRSFVGPKKVVDGIWERIRGWHRRPALVRALQPVYMLGPAELAPAEPADARRAHPDEAPLVAEHSAQMILGELGYDPRETHAGFVTGVRRAIERGWWWVWIVDGELRFQCNIGARTSATVQIQGVWTPPALRGRGYARRGLAAISASLLGENPTVSLYVNDFNHDAIALYERIGFVRTGELSTYLFS